MKSLFTIVMFLAALPTPQAQVPPFAWVKGIGGTGYEGAHSIAVDGAGNAYITGHFFSTIDFDPGPGTVNLPGTPGGTMFICKFDPSGNLVWARSIGSGTTEVHSESVALDASGNVYTTGYFFGTQDMDPGPGTFTLNAGTNASLFVCKLNASGNFVWAKQCTAVGSGINTTAGNKISVDQKGKLYITGTVRGAWDLDPGPGTFNLTSIPAGSYNVLIMKLDTAGSFAWAKSMGGAGTSAQAMSMATDMAGNVYTVGNFQGTVDFDPGAPVSALMAPAGQPNGFVSRLDSSGNFVWAKQLAGNYSTIPSMAIDASGNICLTGSFSDTVDFDPGRGTQKLISAGKKTDAYIAKLNSSGNLVWVKSLSSTEGEAGTFLTLDKSGNIYCSGGHTGTLDFDPGAGVFNLTSLGASDGFIAKYNPGGGFLWAIPLSGNGPDQGGVLSIDAGGNLFAAGAYEETIDFDPGAGTANLTSSGASDIYLLKLGNMGIPNSVSGSSGLGHSLRLYPNPATGNVTICSSIALQQANIHLLSVSGQQVKQWAGLSGTTLNIDISDQPAGMYMVEVISEGEVARFSFVKQ